MERRGDVGGKGRERRAKARGELFEYGTQHPTPLPSGNSGYSVGARKAHGTITGGYQSLATPSICIFYYITLPHPRPAH